MELVNLIFNWREKPTIWRNCSHWLIFHSLRLLSYLAQRVSPATAIGLGHWLGWLAYYLFKQRRVIAKSNLASAFSDDLSAVEIDWICRSNFRQLGQTVIEFLRFPIFTARSLWKSVEMEGEKHLMAALQKKKGVILFLPHFGNWEILSLAYGDRFPNRVKAIAFRLKNRLLSDWVWSYRQQLSTEIIPQKRAIRETLRSLKKNEIVGFLADQNAANAGVFVEFFGKPVYAVKGPIALAIKTGSPILFSIAIRQPDGKHKIYVHPPTSLRITNDYESDIQFNTQKMLSLLETYIRQYPDQWLWIHNRWKIRPRDESDQDSHSNNAA